MLVATLIRLLPLTALMLLLPAGVIKASGEEVKPFAISVSSIEISFKLDPRITQGIYMGDRWVSPPTYSAVGEEKELTVEARAQAFDARRRPTEISPQWIPADPAMVTVSPDHGRQVKITVRRAGESKLKVMAQGYSRELSIKATVQSSGIQVEISQ